MVVVGGHSGYGLRSMWIWIKVIFIVDMDEGHSGYGWRSGWIWMKVIVDMDEGHNGYG